MRKFHTLKKEIQEFSHRVTELTEFLTPQAGLQILEFIT